MRALHTVLVRASEDIGRLCGEFVRSERFARRVKGMTGRVLRRMANAEGIREADLLSYVMFDGEFASEVMALGESDARAKGDKLCELFEAIFQSAN
jgi:NTE family protein